jgi:transmembrane E3 ubiquitin-protein ligase
LAYVKFRIHPDIRDVPSIVPADHSNETARVVELELASRIAKFLQLIDSGTYDTETPPSGEISRTSLCPILMVSP